MNKQAEDDQILHSISYKLKPGTKLGFRLDEGLRIVSMSPDSCLMFKFCIYDQICFIDETPLSTHAEAVKLLTRSNIQITVKILRSKYINIISYDQQVKLNLKRQKGYAYFLAVLENTGEILGFSINDINNGSKFYVMKVEKVGLARRVLQEGDFLHDYEGRTIPSKAYFKMQIADGLLTYGKYAVVVERAVDMEAKVMVMNNLHLKAPEIIRDLEMPLDCRNIATRQIQIHMMNKTLIPKSILKTTSKNPALPGKKEQVRVEETSDTVIDKTNATKTGEDDEENAAATATTNTSVAEEESNLESRKVSFKPGKLITKEDTIGTDAVGPLQKVPKKSKPHSPSKSPLKSPSKSPSNFSNSSRAPRSSVHQSHKHFFAPRAPAGPTRYDMDTDTVSRVFEQIQKDKKDAKSRREKRR